MKPKIWLIVLLLVSFFGITASAFAMTLQEKQALIVQIQQQLSQLQQQLTQQLGQTLPEQQGTTSWCYTFNQNVGYVNSGSNDVANLHTALDQQGISYSPDDINTYSNGTFQAIIQFQAKYGISPQSGYVGILTRKKLNSLYQCGSTACKPKWQCYNWSSCHNGQETRSCYDTNNCNATSNKPLITQMCTASNCNNDSDCGWSGLTGNSFCQAGNVYRIYTTYICNKPGTPSSFCTSSKTDKLTTTCAPNQYCKDGSCTIYSCNPNWVCTGFGTCINGVQTQDCYDKSNCADATNKPSLARSCTNF